MVTTTRNISRHCQKSLGGRNHPRFESTLSMQPRKNAKPNSSSFPAPPHPLPELGVTWSQNLFYRFKDSAGDSLQTSALYVNQHFILKIIRALDTETQRCSLHCCLQAKQTNNWRRLQEVGNVPKAEYCQILTAVFSGVAANPYSTTV